MKWIILLAVLFFADFAEAATYWVSKGTGGGKQGQHCTSGFNTTPPPSLDTQTSGTINQGMGCLKTSGDILYIMDGTYNESIQTHDYPIPNGTSGARTKIAAYNTRQVIVRPPTT